MTERAGVQRNPLSQHPISAPEPRPPLGTLHHVELWVPDPVIEQSPALTASDHDRLRPGLNHLAFHAGPPGHYAAYLANTDAFEVELVATEPCPAA